MNKRKSITNMAAIYGRELKNEALKAYAECFEGFSDEEVAKACAEVSSREKFWPAPAVVLEVLNRKGDAKLGEDARLRCYQAKASLEEHGPPAFDCAITARIMSVDLPWSEWKGRSPEEVDKFFSPQFIKHFKRYSISPADMGISQKALPAPAGPKSEREAGKAVRSPEEQHIMIKQNREWLEDLEKRNGILLPRHDQIGCYSNQKCRGGVILFVWSNFQQIFKNCEFREEEHPQWAWEGKRAKPFERRDAKLPEDFSKRFEMGRVG